MRVTPKLYEIPEEEIVPFILLGGGFAVLVAAVVYMYCSFFRCCDRRVASNATKKPNDNKENEKNEIALCCKLLCCKFYCVGCRLCGHKNKKHKEDAENIHREMNNENVEMVKI